MQVDEKESGKAETNKQLTFFRQTPAEALHLPDRLPLSLAYLGRAHQTLQTNTLTSSRGLMQRPPLSGLSNKKQTPQGGASQISGW